MDGRTNESPPVFYRTSSPSGPLPKKAKKRREQVAQGQYVVSDTRCPALHNCELDWGEAGQRPRRGQSPVEHRGTFVCAFIHCTMVWEHTTSGQEKLRQHFGPITWAKTGTVAYWKQENIWFYLRPSSSKASFSTLKLTTSLKIKFCKKWLFDFICDFSRHQKWY